MMEKQRVNPTMFVYISINQREFALSVLGILPSTHNNVPIYTV